MRTSLVGFFNLPKKSFQVSKFGSLFADNFNLVALIKQILRKIKKISNRSFFTSNYSKIGRFRLGGEIHQWMYDRYSLT